VSDVMIGALSHKVDGVRQRRNRSLVRLAGRTGCIGQGPAPCSRSWLCRWYRANWSIPGAYIARTRAGRDRKRKRPARRQAVDLFGCEGLQPDPEALANQV